MAKLKKTISIDAPVEKVFDFIILSTNLPEIWSNLVEVKDMKPAPVGGYNFNFVFKMAGMRFEGANETIECIPNQRLVTKSTKGIESKFVFTYLPDNGGTKLTLEIEYTIPVPLLGKFAEALIIKQNDREMDTMLANLKARMEA